MNRVKFTLGEDRLWLLLLSLLHDLYSANFEDRVRGAGVARWRT